MQPENSKGLTHGFDHATTEPAEQTQDNTASRNRYILDGDSLPLDMDLLKVSRSVSIPDACVIVPGGTNIVPENGVILAEGRVFADGKEVISDEPVIIRHKNTLLPAASAPDSVPG